MIINTCSKKDQDYIVDRLVEYNLSQVNLSQQEAFIDLSRKIVKDGFTIAGITATMYCWNIVYVGALWVDLNYRRNRIGSILLNEIEKDAKSKGAKLIHLDTFDFQAKEFYKKHGYIVFGQLDDCPENHCRFYMKKTI